MMKRISIATVILLGLAGRCPADERPPEPLDVDEALARQSVVDLISGAASAYDCSMALHSIRRIGAAASPVFFVEVQMEGPGCNDALLLLARHGSERNFVFRRWEPAPDVHAIAPGESGEDAPGENAPDDEIPGD